MIQKFHFCYMSKGNKVTTLKISVPPMFIAALVTVAKTWK